MSSSGAPFFKKMLLSGVMQLLVVLSTLLMGVMVARTLGVTRYGEYVYLMSLSVLVGIPTTVGLSNLLVRFGASYEKNKKLSTLKGLWIASLVFILCYSLLVLLLLLLLKTTGWLDVFFVGIVLLVPVMALHQSSSSMLRSQGKIKTGQAILALAPVILVLILLGSDVNDSDGVILKYIYALSCAALIGYTIAFCGRINDFNSSGTDYEFPVWRGSLLHLSLYSGINVVDSQFGVLILQHYSESGSGLFKVALSSAAFVTFGLTAVNMVLAPKVAAYYSSHQTEKLQRLISNSSKVSSIVALFISVVFISYGTEIITYVFGESYVKASAAFKILVIASLINACFGSVVLILNMTGNEKYTVKGMILALIVNVALCAVFVPIYGVEGAAGAAATSMIIWNLYLSRVIRRKLGLVSHAFFTNSRSLS
jgi:O-antigen/teichoic acid export membrane protein